MVLAGGTSRRMRVADKTRLLLAGRPLLDHVLGALPGAERVIAVGTPRPAAPWGPGCVNAPRAPASVAWTREEPAGGGPAAAVAAGLRLTAAPIVMLLAGDLPLVTAEHVQALLDAATSERGAVAVDADGRRQWLFSAWPRSALLAADLPHGGSLHRAFAPLDPAPVTLDPDVWLDCDTPEDLARAERLLADRV